MAFRPEMRDGLPAMPASLLKALMPPLFVLIWATGFIVARLVAPFADPITFLSLRFALAALVLAILALVVRAPWPGSARQWRNGLIAGALLHGIYLAGVFWAVKHGLPAGIAALVWPFRPSPSAVSAPFVISHRGHGVAPRGTTAPRTAS